VLNRFTGRFEFVPADEEDEGTTPTRKASADRRVDRRLLAASDSDRLSGQRLCPPPEAFAEKSASLRR